MIRCTSAVLHDPNRGGKVKMLILQGGAREQNRTADLLITNELLYQLSYPGVASKRYQLAGLLRTVKD